MSEKTTPVAASATPHDRVASLSLRQDGTPDQTNPELIGDKDDAMAATKRQFAEFAVSAVDHQKRTADAVAAAEGSTADAEIDKVKAEHEKVEKAAEAKAEAVVNSLHQG